MSLVGRIVGASAPQARVAGEDTLTVREPFVGIGTGAGSVVSVESSLQLDSVFAAVTLLSESVGALPLKVYERRAAGRAEVYGDPSWRLLHTRPNPDTTAIALWSMVMTHLATWGNSYLGKELRGPEIVALWPMYPERMRVSREHGRKVFRYRNEAGVEEVHGPDEVIHIHGISLDGISGLSPIAYARLLIASGLAGDEFTGRFYRNSATPRGVLEVPGELSDVAAERLADNWRAAHQGVRNMHKVAVLEGGVKFNPITMPLEDAQFVEQQKLTVQKVARIFRVPPEMIGGETGDSLTYSTVEGQGIHFLTWSLNPWLVRIEQALAADSGLFSSEQRYPEFLRDAILRADAASRAAFYEKALDPVKGWMSRPEVRQLENLPPETDRAPVQLATAARADMARVLAEISAARDSRTTNGGARHVVPA